jgi:hypothetical protein
VTFRAAFHHGCPSKEVVMERIDIRTKRLLNLQRIFELSRLEDQLVAAAYELALPIRRQPLSTTRPHEDEIPKGQSPSTQGGLSA